MATSWERLANVTLSSTGDTLTTGTFTAKGHLMVTVVAIPSGNANPKMTLNNDGGSNYTRRRAEDGGSDDASQSHTDIDFGRNATELIYATFNIINIATKSKLVIGHTATNNTNGSGNCPKRSELLWRWNNTSDAVTRIDVANSQNGDFAVGSTLTVWGADDQGTSPFYPNIPNGGIFEESDTGKHYMWDGTDTWNEVT